MFFESNTAQYSMVNGKKSGQEKHVTIKNGKVVSNVSVPLTEEEIKKAQSNIFIPKFWENCNPGNVSCTIRNASNKKTRKHRRH